MEQIINEKKPYIPTKNVECILDKMFPITKKERKKLRYASHMRDLKDAWMNGIVPMEEVPERFKKY